MSTPLSSIHSANQENIAKDFQGSKLSLPKIGRIKISEMMKVPKQIKFSLSRLNSSDQSTIQAGLDERGVSNLTETMDILDDHKSFVYRPNQKQLMICNKQYRGVEIKDKGDERTVRFKFQNLDTKDMPDVVEKYFLEHDLQGNKRNLTL